MASSSECPNCGSVIDEGLAFCPECGSLIPEFLRYPPGSSSSSDGETDFFWLITGTLFYSILLMFGIGLTSYNIITGLITILYGITGLYYYISTRKIDIWNNDWEVAYWYILAPIAWIITSNVILYRLGYTPFGNPPHVFYPIWLISSLIWYEIPMLALIIIRRIPDYREKKDIKKQKKITQRQELLAKYPIVEDLIQEKNFSKAIIELNYIFFSAKVHKFREIYNWAKEKLTLCENFERDLETFEKSIPMVKKIIQEKTISEATYDLKEIIGETKAKAIRLILTTFKDVVQEIYNNNLSEIEKSSYVNLNIKDLAENQELHQIFEKLVFPYSFRIKF